MDEKLLRCRKRSMAIKRMYLLPLVLFVLVPLTFFITYAIAVLNEHVDPGFPYISDTGAQAPESCIFGQLLNLAAFMMSICVYIKYLEVKYYSDLVPSAVEVYPKVNKIGLLLGLLSCLGLDLVANFQETNVIVVHMIGAFMCFGSGTLYFLVQAWISYKMPELASKRLVIVRVFLVAICFVATVTTIVTGTFSMMEYDGPNNGTFVSGKWRPEDGGFELHLVSTISEWILCITFCVLILSFVPEFYDLELAAPVIRYKQKTEQKTNIEY